MRAPYLALLLTLPFIGLYAEASIATREATPAELEQDLQQRPPLLLEEGMQPEDTLEGSDGAFGTGRFLMPGSGSNNSCAIGDSVGRMDFQISSDARRVQFTSAELRPKLLVVVNKNDPNPCDEAGRQAKLANPNLVFVTMRLYDQSGTELAYPTINEVASFDRFGTDEMDIFNYRNAYTSVNNERASWTYADPRASVATANGKFIVRAPQFNAARSCIYISSGGGMENDTPVGFYRPVNGRLYPAKTQAETYVSNSYKDPMPWAVFFYRGYAMHATGADKYRQVGGPASHGCVRQSLQDSEWVFQQIRNTWSTEPNVHRVDPNGSVLAAMGRGYDTIIRIQGQQLEGSRYFRSQISRWWDRK